MRGVGRAAIWRCVHWLTAPWALLDARDEDALEQIYGPVCDAPPPSRPLRVARCLRVWWGRRGAWAVLAAVAWRLVEGAAWVVAPVRHAVLAWQALHFRCAADEAVPAPGRSPVLLPLLQWATP